MNPKYREGDVVAVTQDYPELGLSKGDTGTVLYWFNISPPVYEVTFRDGDGKFFDMTCYDEEIVWPAELAERDAAMSSERSAALASASTS